ncbi:hypothetical protein AYX13_07074 [Cryptococcus neoformans]|nr:hypothetical protein AYX13_07074 [Cryptococcus neoformans var. grubii]
MEEEVLEVWRQEMRGRFQKELLVALGMSHKRKCGDGDDLSKEWLFVVWSVLTLICL